MLVTEDEHVLEAELAPADDPRVAIGALPSPPHVRRDDAVDRDRRALRRAARRRRHVPAVQLPRVSRAASGTYDEGRGERLDVTAAIDALAEQAGGDNAAAPDRLVLRRRRRAVGRSTRGSTAWLAIAPPLRFLADPDAVGARPAAEVCWSSPAHDEFRPPDEVNAAVGGRGTATDVERDPAARATSSSGGPTEVVDPPPGWWRPRSRRCR